MYEYNHHYYKKKRRHPFRRFFLIASCLAAVGAGSVSAVFFSKKYLIPPEGQKDVSIVIDQDESGSLPFPANGADSPQPEVVISDSPVGKLLAQAGDLASGYDYDAAIALLQSDSQYALDPAVQAAVAGYEATKATLVEAKISDITHVFFHSIVMDNSKAFDGDSDSKGYNQVMTTASEFEKILQIMYDKGYVLVRLHDMAYEVADENGNMVMKPGSILLPEGKTPFVMSQDDVCYYPYMNDDGFATRIIVGDDGKPTCEMKVDDDTTLVGSYDLVPLLEDFIQTHPGVSYKGARAVIALTGYEGIFGYRTAEKYAGSPTYEQEQQEAARVAQCLRDNGWELASHSWGHLNLGTVEIERFYADTDNWKAQVESLIGPTDIILYPFGADINDWRPYTAENKRFVYLYQAGFRYFCNVDSNTHWVQLGENYIRQGRRNLDGYRMWKDIVAESEGKERKLADLFRAEDVFDPDRPTPVPEME